MALTGVIGIGFILLHVALNLLAYAGPAAVNDADRFLKSTGGWLWLARAILLAAVVLHVVAAYQLSRMSWASRPVGYQQWKRSGRISLRAQCDARACCWPFSSCYT